VQVEVRQSQFTLSALSKNIPPCIHYLMPCGLTARSRSHQFAKYPGFRPLRSLHPGYYLSRFQSSQFIFQAARKIRQGQK
jgi:hypothetical protein